MPQVSNGVVEYTTVSPPLKYNVLHMLPNLSLEVKHDVLHQSFTKHATDKLCSIESLDLNF